MEQTEICLYRAVMLQTIKDLLDAKRSHPDRKALRRRDLAFDWIADDANYPFSFRDCCRILGIEPRRARKALEELRDSARASKMSVHTEQKELA